jgi:phytol kinase
MNTQLISLMVFLSILTGLMVITVVLHKYFKLSTEQSRKFLHVSGGVMCLFFPLFFKSHWWVLALASTAFCILLITYKRKMLPAVHATKRYSLGSVLFPFPVYGCFLIAELNHSDLLFYLPISLLAISDTAAEIGGNKWGAKSKQFSNGQKTLAGTICFFITAILVSFGWLYFGFHLQLADALKITIIVAALSSISELVTLHGWDNITVPMVTVLILQAFS